MECIRITRNAFLKKNTNTQILPRESESEFLGTGPAYQ